MCFKKGFVEELSAFKRSFKIRIENKIQQNSTAGSLAVELLLEGVEVDISKWADG